MLSLRSGHDDALVQSIVVPDLFRHRVFTKSVVAQDTLTQNIAVCAATVFAAIGSASSRSLGMNSPLMMQIP